MLSSINFMGFSTLPAMEPRHQAGWAPTIPSLFCFHQHWVISSFNYSPAFSSVLSSCQAPLPSKLLIYAQSFCCGFECSYPQSSSFAPTLIHQLLWELLGTVLSITLKDYDLKYMTLLSSWRNVISKDLCFSCTQAGPIPRILRQFLPNYFSLSYAKPLCNSTSTGHFHSCWQQQNLNHWVQDQPGEKHQECALHSLFTDEYTVQGNSARIWDGQSSCAHLIPLWDDRVAEVVS